MARTADNNFLLTSTRLVSNADTIQTPFVSDREGRITGYGPFTFTRDGPAGVLTTPYYDEAGLLLALERGGARFYVATDQVGTPRLVTDSTGQVLKVLEFDSFGNLISDSNPGFDLPIGFGGGLTDPLTGLVRFGLRDYDPEAGRWAARDPIRFSCGQGNLFAYFSNDPVNLRDPLGLFCLGFSAYVGIGGGAQICIGSGGLSVCGEAGFGLDAKTQLDSGGVADNGAKIGAELSVKCGPAGIGVSASIDDKGCTEFELQGELGVANFEGDKVGAQGEIEVPKIEIPKTSCGIQGKVNAKICGKAGSGLLKSIFSPLDLSTFLR